MLGICYGDLLLERYDEIMTVLLCRAHSCKINDAIFRDV
jgi:hypothetical protein